MAYLAPIQTSPNHTNIIVTYRTGRKDVPVYVASSANNWEPEEMQVRDTTPASAQQQPIEQQESNESSGEVVWERVFKVPNADGCIFYKFRVGDGQEWVYNPNCPTGTSFNTSALSPMQVVVKCSRR